MPPAARLRRPAPRSRVCTCSATARGRVLYVGKSVSIRSRARAHFAPCGLPAAPGLPRPPWSTTRDTNSELGALVLENRLIKQHKPPGNMRLTRRDERLSLFTSAAAWTSRSRSSRSLRARRRARGHVGPLRGRGWPGAGRAARLAVGCVIAAGGSRAVSIPRRTVRWGAAFAVPGRSRSEPVPPAPGRALGLFVADATGAGAARACRGTDAHGGRGAALRARGLAAPAPAPPAA